MNSLSLLSPIIAAQMVSAFYAALLLKKQCGVEITPELEKTVWDEVFRRWAAVVPILTDAALKLMPSEASSGQSPMR